MRGDVARLFDAMADSYDELEPWYVHLYRVLHDRLRAELGAPGLHRGRALDAGCGTGYQGSVLRELGYATHGVDLSPALLRRARRRLGAAALVRGDLEQLPYRAGAFDVVTCCGSTLSLVDDPARALRGLGMVLRPGGLLFLECEHKWSLDVAWSLVSGLAGDALGYGVAPRELLRQLTARDGCRVPYPCTTADGAPAYMSLRLFTRRELSALLAQAGFVSRRAWGIHAVTNMIPSTVLHRPRLSRAVAALFTRLCALDAALSGAAPVRALANSLVVLAVKSDAQPPRPT